MGISIENDPKAPSIPRGYSTWNEESQNNQPFTQWYTPEQLATVLAVEANLILPTSISNDLGILTTSWSEPTQSNPFHKIYFGYERRKRTFSYSDAMCAIKVDYEINKRSQSGYIPSRVWFSGIVLDCQASPRIIIASYNHIEPAFQLDTLQISITHDETPFISDDPSVSSVEPSVFNQVGIPINIANIQLNPRLEMITERMVRASNHHSRMIQTMYDETVRTFVVDETNPVGHYSFEITPKQYKGAVTVYCIDTLKNNPRINPVWSLSLPYFLGSKKT